MVGVAMVLINILWPKGTVRFRVPVLPKIQRRVIIVIP